MTAKMDGARALAVRDDQIGSFVERAAQIISGAPFPSGRSLYKARGIADLMLEMFAAPASHDAQRVGALAAKWRAAAADSNRFGTTDYERGCAAELTACASDLEAALSTQQQATPKGDGSDYYWGKPAFKNFHRSLCARFGYTHDEEFWWRDQVSLEEHIAAKTTPKPEGAGALAGDGELRNALATIVGRIRAFGTVPDLAEMEELLALSAAPVAAQGSGANA